MKELTTLYLDYNILTELPSDIAKLTNLTELGLNNNHLRSLPVEIVQLKNLTRLKLSNNQLSRIPTEVTYLRNLKELYLDDNPLKQPPPEIATQGVEAVFEYLDQLSAANGGQVVNEAKLILVGQGDVGKTCLANRLIYDRFVESRTTEGIDILDWTINAPSNQREEIKLNLWDFGGQEIYHATHQFFLTRRSIYLLVWNARKSQDYEHIHYWLHTIEAFGWDSPVVLVMTKKNERDDDLNMKDLRKKFSNIVELCKVDSLDGTGIEFLRELIKQKARELPHMQTVWIPEWVKVRKRLEQDTRKWIDYEEFQHVCTLDGVGEKQIDYLAEYLHNLGSIIHFRDRLKLRNMVILKPEWATGAVYKILDTQSVRDRGGILLHNELEQVWDSSIYPIAIYDKLLELMNKFELAYELPDKQSHLVAELLPKTEPDFEWNNVDNLCFRYRYDFLPAGVMTRFMVLVHEDLDVNKNGRQLVWREGAVLRREDTRAFVKVWPLEKLIEIKIDGRKKRELLAIIRHQFDHINSSIRKIDIKQEIPCNCSESCHTIFDYSVLITGEQNGQREVQCLSTWKNLPLTRLLDGYESHEKRMQDWQEIAKEKGDIYLYISPTQNVSQVVSQVQESKQEIRLDVDLKVDLPSIQSDFEELKKILKRINPELDDELEKIEDKLDEVSSDSEKEKLKSPLNKLGRFLKKLADEKSDLYKILKGTQKGIEIAQKVCKTYNKFAQYLALPQVPDLFLGK